MRVLLFIFCVFFSHQSFAKCYRAITATCSDLGVIYSDKLAAEYEQKEYFHYALPGFSKKGQKKTGYFRKGDEPVQKNLIKMVDCMVWHGGQILNDLAVDPTLTHLDDAGLRAEAAKRAGVSPSDLTPEVQGLAVCTKQPKK